MPRARLAAFRMTDKASASDLLDRQSDVFAVHLGPGPLELFHRDARGLAVVARSSLSCTSLRARVRSWA